MRTDAEYPRQLDREDDLAHFRDEFVIDDPDVIYLDGNSLGRLPKATAARLRVVVEHEWGARLVRGWNEGWFTAPQQVGAKLAQLLGAQSDEVIICDSTSVNLFKLVLAARQARPGRRAVVTDELNFPSDVYVMQGALRLAGGDCQLKLVRSGDGMTIDPDALSDAIDHDTALVALTHTCFKSGFTYDMGMVTDLAHRAGALMLWDVCHSVGVIPIQLSAFGADLAVGCTYKYLNGGPGAPAFLYVRRDLQELLLNPIWGWFGQRGQFDFGLHYEPAPGLNRFLAGSPPMLSLSAVETGVDLVLAAGVERIRAKSMRQTEYLIALWEDLLAPLGVKLNSPRDAQQRGAHVALGHPHGLRIARSLIQDMHVIPDFRKPDNIRLGLSPLYTSFAEIHESITRFRRVLTEGRYEKYPEEGPEVT